MATWVRVGWGDTRLSKLLQASTTRHAREVLRRPKANSRGCDLMHDHPVGWLAVASALGRVLPLQRPAESRTHPIGVPDLCIRPSLWPRCISGSSDVALLCLRVGAVDPVPHRADLLSRWHRLRSMSALRWRVQPVAVSRPGDPVRRRPRRSRCHTCPGASYAFGGQSRVTLRNELAPICGQVSASKPNSATVQVGR